MSAEPLPAGESPRRALFAEEQRFRQWWIWAMVLIIVGIAWWAFVEQIIQGRPFGANPGPDWLIWIVFVLFGLAMPWFMWSLRLIVEVDADRLNVRFRPLLTRRIPVAEIEATEAVTYRPILDYGGWGVRYSFKRGRAYNVAGNRGVLLTLAGEKKKLLVGSQRADELSAAIDEARARR